MISLAKKNIIIQIKIDEKRMNNPEIMKQTKEKS